MSSAASAQYPQGLLVGGMSDGAVSVWDVAAIMRGEGEHAAVAEIIKHASAVRSLAFNPHHPHLIAAASADGDISIISLETPSKPVITSCVRAARPFSA